MASKVYFMTDRSTSRETSLVAKALTVFDAAGFDRIIQPHDVVAIKVHAGEYNNTAYLRPVYARAIADRIKELGGRPFVTDTTTLPYSMTSSRATALDHLLTAERNGYNSGTLGCPFIIGDGYIGSDDYRVDLPEGYLLKEQYVSKAIACADVMIVLTHFKGHGSGVYGGSVKNIGIGAVSKRGKMNVHQSGDPRHGIDAAHYYPHLCTGRSCPNWETCESVCPYDLIHITEDSIEWERDECRSCNACFGLRGPCGVLTVAEDQHDATASAIADSALAVVKAVGREKCGFINMAVDIAPSCDCVMFSDRPIVGNIGVFASKDPIAVDAACLDAVTKAEGMPGSRSYERGVMEPGLPKFPSTSSARGGSQNLQIRTGVRNGLGSDEYELITCPPGNGDRFSFHWDQRTIGVRLRRAFSVDPVYPEGGFKRSTDAELEEVR